jgi:protocatechuate 3,4-dioxygenase beta subunit
MKPLHIAVAAAVLLVAALVVFLVTSDGERADTRRATGRESRGARDGGGDGDEAATAAGVGGEANAGAGTLSIALRIVDADGNPAGGAEAEIDRGLDALRVAADGEGALRVSGLATGIYDLRARHGKQAGALRFELRKTTDLGTLKLSATVAVRGRVLGPRGEPLPGARVEACGAAESMGLDMTAAIRSMAQPDEVLARARSGDDGAYELALPEGGTYALRATAEGFAQQGEPARRYAADTDGIDFWLMPGALLQGHVVDARQSPVAGARVLVVDPMSLFGKRMPKAETAAGADGAFSMVVQPAQQSMLIVRAAGYASHMQGNLTLPQTNLLVTLEEGVSLTFQAVDAERPEVPAPHVNVIAVYQGGFGAGETDDSGRLLIENLPTRGTGMGNQQQALLWGGGYIAQSIDIARNDPVDGVVDLGVVKVAPGGTIRGRVLDKTTGEPIAGAHLRTFGGLDMELELFGTVPAVSAADGSFKLTGVALAAHTILATHPDYVGDVDPGDLFGGMGGGSGGGPPLFPEGSRDVEKDVELMPAEIVTGVVLAPDGSPVAGASVTETSDERMIFTQMLGGGPGSATSDEHGAFALKGLRAGAEATVAATHRDYGPSESARVRAGAGESVTLRLAEPLTIKGVVVDEKGAAVAGARVMATRAAEAGPPTPFDSGAARPTVTDGEGRYLLRNVPAGNLVVTFDHPDFAILKTELSLAAAHDLGRTVLPRGASIGGEIVDADGKALASVSVHAWKRDAVDFGSGGRVNASAVTDDKGRFRMAGLADGEYQLRVWDQRYYSSENVAKSGGADVRIVLRAAGRLVGRVTARGVPVAGASVRAQRADDFVGWARTGQDGGFVMESLPPDEPFDVTVTHDAYRELKVEAVRASADRTQDFVMQPGAEVSGRVVDGNGRGVHGAEVDVRVDGQYAKQVETDASGAFKAGGLGDGRISVRLDASEKGFIPTEWIDVAPGARDVRLLATPGESISGTVRDREGKPLERVSLMAVDGSGNTVASTWIWDESGTFELRGLRPGTYTLLAQLHVEGQKEPVMRQVPGVATGTKGVEIRFQ